MFPGAHRSGAAHSLTRVKIGDCHECLPIGLVLKGDPDTLPLIQSALIRDMGEDLQRLVKRMLDADPLQRPDAANVYQTTCAATEVFRY